jgi:predicted nucleic acid-binding protein
MDKENRVGPSDRTHLAYAVSYNDDYFVTSDGDLLHFPLDSNKCRKCGKETKIIGPESLRDILNS